MSELIEQLKRHEGYRRRPYYCTGGFLSVGYGYNLDANPLRLPTWQINEIIAKGASEQLAERLLKDMVRREEAHVDTLGLQGLDEVRRAVLVNMSYNLGFAGLLKFKRMLTAVRAHHWHEAASEMLDSTYARQVKGRAIELAEQMRTGRWRGGDI